MEESQNIDFKGISLHMKKEMSRIRMLRIVFRILTSIVYLCTVVWFGFCIFGGFLVDRTDYETSVTTGKYLMIGFAVFFVLHFAFMKCFAALNKRETYTIPHHLPAVPGSKVQSFRFHTAESLCGQPPVRNGIVIGQFGKFDLLRSS
ncbi:hypothetical protein NXV13_11235 [Bacteroides ovatus]|nr:hypothetical protein [Bacteroides ovatus]